MIFPSSYRLSSRSASAGAVVIGRPCETFSIVIRSTQKGIDLAQRSPSGGGGIFGALRHSAKPGAQHGSRATTVANGRRNSEASFVSTVLCRTRRMNRSMLASVHEAPRLQAVPVREGSLSDFDHSGARETGRKCKRSWGIERCIFPAAPLGWRFTVPSPASAHDHGPAGLR